MELSYCVPEFLASEIYIYLGGMHPVKQQTFEITSKVTLIRLLVQYHGNYPRHPLEYCIRHEDRHKMHVPTFRKLFTYNERRTGINSL